MLVTKKKIKKNVCTCMKGTEKWYVCNKGINNCTLSACPVHAKYLAKGVTDSKMHSCPASLIWDLSGQHVYRNITLPWRDVISYKLRPFYKVVNYLRTQ